MLQNAPSSALPLISSGVDAGGMGLTVILRLFNAVSRAARRAAQL